MGEIFMRTTGQYIEPLSGQVSPKKVSRYIDGIALTSALMVLSCPDGGLQLGITRGLSSQFNLVNCLKAKINRLDQIECNGN